MNISKPPWICRISSIADCVHDADKKLIAQVFSKKSESDAKLIAAAPELYQRLVDLIDAIELVNPKDKQLNVNEVGGAAYNANKLLKRLEEGDDKQV